MYLINPVINSVLLHFFAKSMKGYCIAIFITQMSFRNLNFDYQMDFNIQYLVRTSSKPDEMFQINRKHEKQTSPTSISNMRTPRPHQSTARVYDGSVKTSGAKNSGVPQKVDVLSPYPMFSLHRPKSAILTNPSASSSKLSSFKSLKKM